MTAAEFVKLRLSPFRNVHYRSFFAAHNVSLVGSWMQELAKSWIVLSLMGTASAMGALLFAAAVPSILFGTYAGVLADRKGSKGILLITQAVFAVLAFALGLFVTTGKIEYWHLIVFAVLEGTVLAFDIPAFNQVTPQLVPREDFQQAMALNSMSFHLARVLGPSLAGLVMGTMGTAAVFWINAVSFIGVLYVIFRLPLRHEGTANESQSKATMKEAIQYIKNHPVFLRIFLQFALTMSLIFPLVFTTIRILLKERFNLNSHDFGMVFAVPGIGALLGSFIFLILKPANPLKVLPTGITGSIIFLFILAHSATLNVNLVALMFFSVSLFFTLSALLVTVQIRVENHFRGRVSALIGMAFSVLSPLMSVPVGWWGDKIGDVQVISSICVLYAIGSVGLGWKFRTSSHT